MLTSARFPSLNRHLFYLHVSTFDLSDVNRWIQASSDIHDDVHFADQVVPRETVDLHLGKTGAVGVVGVKLPSATPLLVDKCADTFLTEAKARIYQSQRRMHVIYVQNFSLHLNRNPLLPPTHKKKPVTDKLTPPK